MIAQSDADRINNNITGSYPKINNNQVASLKKYYGN